jgi:hypothetical protein
MVFSPFFRWTAIGESSGDGEVAGLRSLLQKERSLTRAVQ